MTSHETSANQDAPVLLDPAKVCTLPPRSRDERLDWVREEILPHAAETLRLDDGIAIELRSSPGLVEQVDRWIELERACCPGIRFERRPGATVGQVRFEMHGADPDAPLLRALGLADAEPARGARIAKAAGAGLALSLFVCCVVPIAAGALLGAAAAPLASLDRPLPIAAGAVLGGAGTWLWLGRRRRIAAEQVENVGERCGPGC